MTVSATRKLATSKENRRKASELEKPATVAIFPLRLIVSVLTGIMPLVVDENLCVFDLWRAVEACLLCSWLAHLAP